MPSGTTTVRGTTTVGVATGLTEAGSVVRRSSGSRLPTRLWIWTASARQEGGHGGAEHHVGEGQGLHDGVDSRPGMGSDRPTNTGAWPPLT